MFKIPYLVPLMLVASWFG